MRQKERGQRVTGYIPYERKSEVDSLIKGLKQEFEYVKWNVRNGFIEYHSSLPIFY